MDRDFFGATGFGASKGGRDGNSREETKKIYNSKIPDIVELPITVVNNVLYAHYPVEEENSQSC